MYSIEFTSFGYSLTEKSRQLCIFAKLSEAALVRRYLSNCNMTKCERIAAQELLRSYDERIASRRVERKRGGMKNGKASNE